MNVTSTTAVDCSVATSSSEESLPNNGEKPNQPKRLVSEMRLRHGLW